MCPLTHILYIHTYSDTDILYIHTATHTYIHTARHTYRHTARHTYRHTARHTYIHTARHTYIQTYSKTYIHTYSDTDIHTYIQRDIHTARQTGITYRLAIFKQSHVISAESTDEQYSSDIIETLDPLSSLRPLPSNIHHPIDQLVDAE